MGFGALHTVSLAEARDRARQARQILLDGEDPLEIARKRRDEARTETAERILFKDATNGFSICMRPLEKRQASRPVEEHAYDVRLPDYGQSSDLSN